ncbi:MULTISPECIES: NAD-dependent epimerase/dehydratase family protein [unclassified Psychrobacter]|uniref:NAD-dependent epimerase/dehydratase family protein n=1 Tax=unclassified Psychrobacter TaxID=196806 RepID=UPI0003FC8635|nr:MULTISPECIES: NAD-dependent epimerase/dehydratase family protein [unclassified Psychrobacter]
MKILVTGGAGFIGSAVIRHIIHNTDDEVLNIDKLTYAGNLESLKEIDQNPRYTFQQIDICDAEAVEKAFNQFKPNLIMHLAKVGKVITITNSLNDLTFKQDYQINTFNSPTLESAIDMAIESANIDDSERLSSYSASIKTKHTMSFKTLKNYWKNFD